MYIKATDTELDFGYTAIQWEGAIPSSFPYAFKKHSLTWEKLNTLNKEEQLVAIGDALIKTINSRKRQYLKCQFCGEKYSLEHRFDKDTCYGCATSQYDTIY